MFSISQTIDGTTYTIGEDDLPKLLDRYAEVEGLHGLAARVELVMHDIAKRAVEPIAAADQAAPAEPATTPGVSDELSDLIRNAPDTNALKELYRAHKDKWNGDYNKLAGKRRQQLERKGGK